MKPRTPAIVAIALIASASTALAQDSPFPPGMGGARVDLALYQPPPEEWFRDAAARWARNPEEQATCELVVERWAISERDADAKEFRTLRDAEHRLAAHRADPGGWRSNPEAVSLYVDAVQGRHRANARRVARETALLAQLCAACGRDAASADALTGRIAAWRGASIPVPIEGGCVDLAAVAAPAVDAVGIGEQPAADGDLLVFDRYLAAMRPRWDRKLQARAEQLEANAATVAGTADPDATLAASREFLESSIAITVGNLLWASEIARELHPSGDECQPRIAAADRLRSMALQRTFPGVPVDCGDETTRALVHRQWRQLTELVDELAWWSAVDSISVRFARMRVLARPADAASGADPSSLLQGISQVHGMALEVLDSSDFDEAPPPEGDC